MQPDFTNLETELRDIETAFATGRMNAFGSASTQDAFVHELRRIAEIETQVFYRTCALLKSSNTNGHTLVTNMYASAQPPPQSQRSTTSNANNPNASNLGDSSFRGSGTTLDTSILYRNSISGSTAQPRQTGISASPSTMNSGRSGLGSPGVSRPQSRNGRENMPGASPTPFGLTSEGSLGTMPIAPHIRQSEWANEDGFGDKAFEDVAAHFDELESQFTSLGDYLRDISKHVIRLNDMSEQVNNGGSGGGVFNNANNISLNGNNQSCGQSASNSGRRVRSGSFDDDGGAPRGD